MALGSLNRFGPAVSGSAQTLTNWTERMLDGQNGCGPCDWPPATHSGSVTLAVQTTIEPPAVADQFYDISAVYIGVAFSTPSSGSSSDHYFEMDSTGLACFPASAMHVQVFYPASPSYTITLNPGGRNPQLVTVVQPRIVICATIGRNHASDGPPTRTLRPVLTDQVSEWMPIPNYAQSVTQLRCDGSTFIIEFSRWADPSGDVSISTLDFSLPTPVPRTARYFRVVDQGNLQPTDYSAIRFTLQL
jgi:hypothetical protein